MTILAGPTQCCCCCRIYGTCWAVFLWNLENVIFAIFWQIWHSPGFSVTSAFSVTVVKCIDFEQFANMTFSRYQRNTENMANVHFSRSQCNIANMTFSRCFCGNEGPGFWGLKRQYWLKTQYWLMPTFQYWLIPNNKDWCPLFSTDLFLKTKTDAHHSVLTLTI